MKLREYLREQHGMTYDQYRSLSDIERWKIEAEFNFYNATLQRKNNSEKILSSRAASSGRPHPKNSRNGLTGLNWRRSTVRPA